jgi:hypothetical protein
MDPTMGTKTRNGTCPVRGDRRKAVMDLTMGAMVTKRNRTGQGGPERGCHGPHNGGHGTKRNRLVQERPENEIHGPYDGCLGQEATSARPGETGGRLSWTSRWGT